MPENLPLDAAAPLLCAGITVYSPMRYFGMDMKGTNFGLVGLGGLGHMAVKFAKAFGMKVTVFSTSPHKEKEARELLGADEFIISKDLDRMKVTTNTPKTKKKFSIISLQFYSRESHSSSAHNQTTILKKIVCTDCTGCCQVNGLHS